MPSSLHPLLFGCSASRSRRYLLVALVEFVGTLATFGLASVLSRLDVAVPVSGAVFLWALALLVVGGPAIQAYRNDGLLVSLALGLAAPLGFYLVLTGFDLTYPSEGLLWGAGRP